MWWFLRLSDILVPRYSGLQHLATFCNILRHLYIFFCRLGFSSSLKSFFFGNGFALFLRDCGISVERAAILYSVLQ